MGPHIRATSACATLPINDSHSRAPKRPGVLHTRQTHSFSCHHPSLAIERFSSIRLGQGCGLFGWRHPCMLVVARLVYFYIVAAVGWRSFKAIKHGVVDFDLLIIWTLLAGLEVYELTVERFFSWFPFYYLIKIGLLIGISLPGSKLLGMILNRVIAPYVLILDDKIEKELLPAVSSILVQLPLVLVNVFFPFAHDTSAYAGHAPTAGGHLSLSTPVSARKVSVTTTKTVMQTTTAFIRPPPPSRPPPRSPPHTAASYGRTGRSVTVAQTVESVSTNAATSTVRRRPRPQSAELLEDKIEAELEAGDKEWVEGHFPASSRRPIVHETRFLQVQNGEATSRTVYSTTVERVDAKAEVVESTDAKAEETLGTDDSEEMEEDEVSNDTVPPVVIPEAPPSIIIPPSKPSTRTMSGPVLRAKMATASDGSADDVSSRRLRRRPLPPPPVHAPDKGSGGDARDPEQRRLRLRRGARSERK